MMTDDDNTPTVDEDLAFLGGKHCCDSCVEGAFYRVNSELARLRGVLSLREREAGEMFLQITDLKSQLDELRQYKAMRDSERDARVP